VKQFRLTQIQVLGAGAAVIVGIALLFLFMFILPMSKKIGKTNENAQGIEDGNRTDRPKFQKELAEAKRLEVEITKKYDEIFEKRMPKVDLSDPITGMLELAYDVPRREGLLIERWFSSSGAQVSGYSFPGFSTTSLPDPNMTALPQLNWNLSVVVRDLPQFLSFLQTFPKAPRFMEVTGVSLPGMRQPGTAFQAGVQVRLYELLKPSPAAAKAAAAAAAAAAAQQAGAAGVGGGAGGAGGGFGGRGMGGGRGGRRGG
jgi:hypothetical protein